MDVFIVLQYIVLVLLNHKTVILLFMVFVVFGLSGVMIRTIMDGVMVLQYMDLRTALDAVSSGLLEPVVDVIVPHGIVVV